MASDTEDMCPECRGESNECEACGGKNVSRPGNDAGRLPEHMRKFQERMRKAIGSPIGTNLDLFGKT